MASASQHNLRILHLTDTHLFGDGSKHYNVVDTTDHLRRALEHVEGQEFDLVVCSGDVSEDGTEASYELVRDVVVPWAESRGARAIFAMGNHDKRAAFRAVLGDGQPGVDTVWLESSTGINVGNSGEGTPFEGTTVEGTTVEASPVVGGPTSPVPAPIVSVATVNGWRTVVLDTSVPGAGYGELGDDQLDFLSAALAEPAEHGTVIVMHHAPVDAQTDLLQALALDEKSARGLWARLLGEDGSGTGVRAILSGHYHLPIVETVSGIPVIVAPGVANIARSFGSRAEESAIDSFGGAVVELSPHRVRVIPFVEPVTGDEVFRFDEELVGKIIDAAGRPTP